jgi:DnaJ-class molecular chaperone
MKIKCPVCEGTGIRISCDEDDMKCHTCGGTGFIEDGKPEPKPSK